jgi:hypothetical protein
LSSYLRQTRQLLQGYGLAAILLQPAFECAGRLDGRYEQDTLLQNICVLLVGYVDCITILGRCVGFVVETYLELDAIRDVRLHYNTSEKEVLAQTRGNWTIASEVPQKEHKIEDVSKCMCLGSYSTESSGGCLGGKSEYYLCRVVHMEQLYSHWTDFHEIWYFNIFRNFVDKFQVS